MNANVEIVFPDKEKGQGNKNGGFKPQLVMKNNSQLKVFESGKNKNICEKSDVQMCKEYVSKRIRSSREHIHQEEDLGSTSTGLSGIGLKLAISSSTNCGFNKLCSPKEKKTRQENEGQSSNHAKAKAKSDEFKAGHIPAIFIQIGAWQRMARHKEDLVAKLYYYKRRLVWEVLEGPLKSKMEIQWSDICAIRAKIIKNEPGMLEIELIRPPMYYRETCLQPKKHSRWQKSYDFTSGQASIWRRHQVTFAPGILEKNYEKLLQFDKELDALSKKPFPRHMSPYFNPTFNQVLHYPYGAYPTILPRENPNPSLPVLDIPFTYQGGGSNNFVAQYQVSWPPSLSIPRDNFGIHETFGISSATTNINNVYDTPLHSTTNVNNVYDPLFPPATNNDNVYDPLHYDPNMLGPLTDIDADLLDNVQLDDALLEALNSIGSRSEPLGNVNNINNSSYRPDFAFNAITDDQVNNNNYELNGMVSGSSSWTSSSRPKQDVFQGSTLNKFQGEKHNMLQGVNDNELELAGNNPMTMGDFFTLHPF